MHVPVTIARVPILLFWAGITGIAGPVFATSFAVVALWFPKQLQGLALGINGVGNIGITVAQLSCFSKFGSPASDYADFCFGFFAHRRGTE